MSREGFEVTMWIAMMVLILAIASCTSAVSCHSKWNEAGYEDVKYHPFFGGCKVQTKDGRWLPTDRVREVQ